MLIAGLISAAGAPRTLLRRWLQGDFEPVVSPAPLAELERVLHDPSSPISIVAIHASYCAGPSFDGVASNRSQQGEGRHLVRREGLPSRVEKK